VEVDDVAVHGWLASVGAIGTLDFVVPNVLMMSWSAVFIPAKWNGATFTQTAGDTVFFCLLRTRYGVERIYIHIPDRRAMTINRNMP
jgi:hypothetical protein